LGTTALVIAVLLLAAGGASLVGAVVQRAEGGYFTTPGAWFSSPTVALLTEEIDVGSGQPGDPEGDVGELARVRIRVHSADPTAPIFVGIGPSDAVHSYLAGTAHEEFAGASFEPFHATFRRVPGAARADPPIAQPFWIATSVGSGPRTLEWDKSRGAYSLVVMQANGAPGIDVFGNVGLRFGFLLPLGIGLVSAALVVLVLAPHGRARVGCGRHTLRCRSGQQAYRSLYRGERATQQERNPNEAFAAILSEPDAENDTNTRLDGRPYKRH
jgi:hypothetical protein